VVIDIVLPAVLGLVLVGEAGIETGCDKLEGLGDPLFAVVGHDAGDWVESEAGEVGIECFGEFRAALPE